ALENEPRWECLLLVALHDQRQRGAAEIDDEEGKVINQNLLQSRSVRRSNSPACGWRTRSFRSSSRKSSASRVAFLSASASAALVTVRLCAAEQVGAQAQRIDVCGSKLPAIAGRFTMIRLAMNSARITPLSTPMAQASLIRSRPRLPVGSKKIGFPVMEIERAKKT
ncbi:MAG TPA: hypothetical protein VFJ49_13620, partial [Methyloceanibacter sp.]|nr:hypothetical protein [Methyloceanibacter sp.]